jgi:hypothetical protein
MALHFTHAPLTLRQLKQFVLRHDLTGLPRYWATVFEVTDLASKSKRTVQRHLNSLDAFYRFAESDKNGYDLDAMLTALEIDKLYGLLTGYFNAERNRALVTNIYVSERWMMTKRFVTTTLEHVANIKSIKAMLGVKSQLVRHEARFMNFSPNPRSKRTSPVRALPSKRMIFVLPTLRALKTATASGKSQSQRKLLRYLSSTLQI